MGKSRNYDREYELVDRLKKENSELKRTNTKLRRENDRLSAHHDKYKTLQEMVHKQNHEERRVEQTKKDWTCFECGKGTMKLHLFPRRDGTFYYRRCSIKECGHQTTMKRHTKEVEES